MQFRTEINFPKQTILVTHQHLLFFIGSCFTENIGNRLTQLKYNAEINPFGIMYNPISIADSLDRIFEKKAFTTNDFFYHDHLWQSEMLHSKWADYDIENLLNRVNNSILRTSDLMKSSSLLFVTFGTAWVYENRNTGKIVANCHKLPAKLFWKRLLSAKEVVDRFSGLLRKLLSETQNLQVVFTLSPVRHLTDGMIENARSKAILLSAIHELCELFTSASYFPAYEVMIDDLRDYRFYEQDMIHPNNAAIDYIFELFKKSYFSTDEQKLNETIEKIVKSLNHRPFNTQNTQFVKFRNMLSIQIEELKKSNPEINFEKEKAQLNNKVF
jgi:hypothetical protein